MCIPSFFNKNKKNLLRMTYCYDGWWKPVAMVNIPMIYNGFKNIQFWWFFSQGDFLTHQTVPGRTKPLPYTPGSHPPDDSRFRHGSPLLKSWMFLELPLRVVFVKLSGCESWPPQAKVGPELANRYSKWGEIAKLPQKWTKINGFNPGVKKPYL